MENDNLDEVNLIAKRMYMTHRKELPNNGFSPIWENTSEEVREWVRDWARAVLVYTPPWYRELNKQPSL